MRSLLIGALLGTAMYFTASCGDDGHSDTGFPTYQDCFDDHAFRLMLGVKESIVECCLRHPIGGLQNQCGAEKSDCINYLTANLQESDAGIVLVTESCDEYIFQRENPPK